VERLSPHHPKVEENTFWPLLICSNRGNDKATKGSSPLCAPKRTSCSGCGHRQIAKGQSVEQRKNRRVRADSQRKARNRYDRESAILAQHANAVADIHEKAFEGGQAPDAVDLFSILEFDQAGCPALRIHRKERIRVRSFRVR
jgi:hypothetical protein